MTKRDELLNQCRLAWECEQLHDLIHVCVEEMSTADLDEADKLRRRLIDVVNQSGCTQRVRLFSAWHLLLSGMSFSGIEAPPPVVH